MCDFLRGTPVGEEVALGGWGSGDEGAEARRGERRRWLRIIDGVQQWIRVQGSAHEQRLHVLHVEAGR
jgi:hypothetical protein